MAAICRSETGTFLGASLLTVEGIIDPVVLEAIAYMEALALAQDLRLQHITVASDCLAVVNAMTSPYTGSYNFVLEEVKADASRLQEASFRHENRESNSEAHRLARFSVSSSVGRQVWLLQPLPVFVSPLKFQFNKGL